MAAMVCEYADRRVAPASALVVICSEEEPVDKIERLRDCDAVCAGLLESVTSTVNEEFPAADGVPEMAPVAASVKPTGSVPDSTLQVYGAVPPVAARLAAYATCTVPAVNDVVVIVTVVTEGEVGESFLSAVLPVTPTQPAIPKATPRMTQISALALRTRSVSGPDNLR